MLQPCENCPFSKSTPIFLSQERRAQILQDVEERHVPFPCHKSVYAPGNINRPGKWYVCIGSALHLHRTHPDGIVGNAAYCFHARHGRLDTNALAASDAEIYSKEEFLNLEI